MEKYILDKFSNKDELSVEEVSDIFRKIRWGSEVICINCYSYEIVKNGLRQDGIQQYRCKDCNTSFNDRTGTIFSETDLDLKECFKIIRLLKEDFSTNKISQKLGRSWKTISKFEKLVQSSLNVNGFYEECKNLEEANKSSISYTKFNCGYSGVFDK